MDKHNQLKDPIMTPSILLPVQQEARIVRRMFVVSTTTLDRATRVLDRLRRSIETAQEGDPLADRPTPT